MKAFIIDDEPLAQEVIQKLASKIPFLDIIGTYDNAFTAMEAINDMQPDLIFLDLEMPGMTGLELLDVVAREGMQVIFTTAYSEYALHGYELNVTDYLLKPIPFERFLKAVNKAYIWHRKNNTPQTDDDGVRSNHEFIWVKQGKKLVQIKLSDVVMVRALADYMEFVMPESKVMVHITMSKLEEFLRAPDFLRVNRSTMVRQGAIRSIEDLQVETILPQEGRISIGNIYWDSIKEHVKQMF